MRPSVPALAGLVSIACSRMRSIPEPFHAGAGRPLPAFPAPSDDPVGAASPTSSIAALPWWVSGCPEGRPDEARLGLLDLCASRATCPMTPPVAPPSTPGRAEDFQRGQDPFAPPRTHATRIPDPGRLPPTGPAAPLLARTRRLAARAATGARALPPMAQLPTCLHAAPFSRCARREGLTPVQRGPRATCRLPACATESIHEHTLDPSSPERFLRRQAAARSVADSDETASQVFTGQASDENPADPHRDDRSPQWISPDLLRPGHLLSRAPVL